MNKENKQFFAKGFRDGFPIALGYFAVAFSLGIAAKNAGLSPIAAALASFLNNASAGQYAGFQSIAERSTYWEIALVTLIANARYLLMSFAMSQKVDPSTKIGHRMLMSFDLTDEIFACSIAQPGFTKPSYLYGCFILPLLGWSSGCGLGALAGNLLPLRVVSAFSVSLYGMFLAVIIPPARKNKFIALIIAICFAASYAFTVIPGLKNLSSGLRTIILTVVIASFASIVCPQDQNVTQNNEKPKEAKVESNTGSENSNGEQK